MTDFIPTQRSTIFPQQKMLYAYDQDDNLLGVFRYSKKRKAPCRRWRARMEGLSNKIVYSSCLVTAPSKPVREKVIKDIEFKLRRWKGTVPSPKDRALKEINRLEERLSKLKEFINQ